MINSWVWGRAGLACLAQSAFFPQLICFLSFTLFLPLTLPVCFLSLSLSLLFSLALSLPDLYFTLPLLPLHLPETNSLATSCSVSQKGRVSLWCHSNPIQHQTVRHATLLTRNSQEGLLRTRSWTGRREWKREAAVLVPNCWLCSINIRRETAFPALTRHAWPYTCSTCR